MAKAKKAAPRAALRDRVTSTVKAEATAEKATPKECHAKQGRAAAGLPLTETHPHECEECGEIFVARNVDY